MRVLWACQLFPSRSTAPQSIDSQKASTACAPQLDSINESLRRIEASLSRASQQMQLQSQVGAIAALDTEHFYGVD